MTGRCTYSYTDDTTPFLKFLYPSAGVPGTKLTLYGFWRMSSTSWISKIKISEDYLCDIFLESLNPDSDMDTGAYQNVYCDVSSTIPAGLYNLTMKTRIGNPYNHYHSYQITAETAEAYQLMVLPEVRAVSAHTGSSKGQVLTIDGNGFGSSASDVRVSIGQNNANQSGLGCDVLEVSNTRLRCRVREGLLDEADTSYTAGFGARFTRYQFRADNPYGHVRTFRDRLISDAEFFTTTPTFVVDREDGYLASLENYMYNTNEAYHVRGWFRAPRSGAHNFQLAGDDQVLLMLNPTPGDTSRANLAEVAYLCSYKSMRSYFYPWNSCDRLSASRSADQVLEQGKLYYYELFAWNSGSEGHFTVSVELPQSTPVLEKNSRYETQGVLIQPQTQFETWVVNVWGFTGQFNFLFVYNDPKWERATEKRTYQQYTASYTASQIDWATNYMGTTVTIENLDASGRIIPSSDNTTEIKGR